MDWTQVLTLFFANAGLIIWFRSESRSDWRYCDAQIKAIHDEMKDFHIKLEKIDSEFKGKMVAQDAEFKGKLALQDLEFKHHIMQYHMEK